MANLKQTSKYYFSVEGETEKWYLDWRLQEKINNEPSAKSKVIIDSKIQKNPISRAKSLVAISKVEITHMTDYESNDDMHTVEFGRMLDKLKEATKLGKQIKYNLGYSNFTFELWIILHKINCSTSLAHRRQYLNHINRAFDESYEDLTEYKQEGNFKKILRKLTLEDVKEAIQRSKAIIKSNEENGFVLQQYKGYKYYRENPSLSVWESVEKILKGCGLI